MTLFRATLVLALALALGCGSDDTASPGGSTPTTDFSGAWEGTSTVTSKRSCDAPVGTQRDIELEIAQNGSVAVLLIDGFIPVNLTIVGSNATGTGSVDLTANGNRNASYTVSLTIAEGQMDGRVTKVDSELECTEVISVTATPGAASAPSTLVGNWDLDLSVTFEICEDVVFGDEESICRSVRANGNTLIIEGGDETLLGLGDGDEAKFWALSDEEWILVRLSVSGSSLSGRVFERDTSGDCIVESNIDGTRRDSACPPLPTADQFVGSWVRGDWNFSNNGCIDNDDSDYIGSCIDITASGSTLMLNTNSPRGILTGSIVESGVEFTKNEAGNTYTVRIERDGDGLSGTAVYRANGGACNAELAFEASASPASCSSAGGPFEGSWSLTGEYIQNGCNFPPAQDCNEIQQFGSLIILDGSSGTVSGNTATLYDEFVTPDGRIIQDAVLQISGDTITGTITVTVEYNAFPENNCSSSASVTMTRTSSCGFAKKTGDLWLGILPRE